MPEYIEREVALKKMCEGCNIEFSDEPCEPYDCRLHRRVREMPAADVVEVVRCNDCKYCNIGYPKKDIGKEAEIGYFCVMYRCCKKSNDFCSYGIRKEGVEG